MKFKHHGEIIKDFSPTGLIVPYFWELLVEVGNRREVG